MYRIKTFLITASLLMLSTLALAHPGHEQASVLSGLMNGFLHPLLGLDHLIVFAGLGYFSGQLTGARRWVFPTVFVVLMAGGFAVGHAGIHIADVEMLLMLSMVFSLLLVGLSQVALHIFNKEVLALPECGVWTVTAFAIFHGFAHGYEVPQVASVYGFGIAFLLSSVGVIALSQLCVNRFVPAQAVC